MFKKKDKSFNKIKSFVINVISVIVVLIALFNYAKANYAINRSESITPGLYKLYPLENIKKGDILTFTVSEELRNFMLERGYIVSSTVGFIKKVGATEGDTVIVGDNLIINGKIIKKLPEADTFGRKLPIKSGKYVLKKDEYFMLGDHQNSFDSSYMGIVKREQLGKKAKLIKEF